MRRSSSASKVFAQMPFAMKIKIGAIESDEEDKDNMMYDRAAYERSGTETRDKKQNAGAKGKRRNFSGTERKRVAATETFHIITPLKAEKRWDYAEG